MSADALPKAYEPQDVEARWSRFWEDNKVFTPDAGAPGEPYSIVIPPPNVTGALHIGHAFNQTLQDVLARYHRQKGKNVLWLPGMDHAGIATQNVVERALQKEGLSRRDLGREEFVKRVWKWKEEYGGRILRQIRSLGSSVDWTRERFTMDDDLARAVRKVFVQLYDEGLIYKGKYIVNWCPHCHTALADDEVEHETHKGALWHVRYMLEDGSGYITIATSRPETILGDSAVCVHPEDERYADLIGKTVIVPIVDRPVRVIADRYVDREFGTGALKVTPCHDPNDWNLGHTHKLEFIQVIDDNGNMNENAGAYAGMSREECREKIVADLEAAGLLEKIEELDHNVGVCYRCKTVIEPYVSVQWFVATTKLAPRARAAVPELIGIFPESWIKTYYNWLDNIRDWCISRQLWWGHRIPAWTCPQCGELIVSETDPAACPKCGHAHLEQDPDVLDTWFSSALWPFSTMGWPEQTKDLAVFYPTSVLVTAFDILFFWVARMIMMGLHFMDEVPFKHVYIHALVRDAQGRKMSKSLGNGIDPIDMINKYGADSLRFTLTALAAMGRDIRLSEERIEGYRHFVNKLWNASRFALMNLGEEAPEAVDLTAVKGLHHKWILHRLEEVKKENCLYAESYRFNDMAQSLYKFLWSEFCDWYLELIKTDFKGSEEQKKEAAFVLYTALSEILVLLHPIIPFVTAEIWQALLGRKSEDIAVVRYPAERPGCLKAEEAADMLFIQECISSIRTVRAELNIAPSMKLEVLLRPADEKQRLLLEYARPWFASLSRVENLHIDANEHGPKASASAVAQGTEIIVYLGGIVDLNDEVARLEKELKKIAKELAGIKGKLANPNFVARAPQEIVEQEQGRAAAMEDKQTKLIALQKRFKEALEG
ncbi:MAG: valine--tRNA ligase [Mailhella sp.]|nr:valine--tRNA ligase [Mailhella sp.]